MTTKTVHSNNQFALATGWKERLWPAARFSLFALAFALVLNVTLRAAAPVSTRIHSFAWQNFFNTCVVIATCLLLTWIFALAQREPLAKYGLGRTHALWNAGIGWLAGIFLLAAILGAMKIFGSFAFGKIQPFDSQMAMKALAYFLLFLAVGVSEEIIWRGYGLVNLSNAISFWPAAVITSAIFASQHIGHAGETKLGLTTAAIFGVVLAYSFRQSGSLWFAIGLHGGWDFGQSFVFGVSNSGVRVPGALMTPSLNGPAWLTGGTAGPEGSVLMVAVFAALVWFIHCRWPEKPNLCVNK